MTAIVDQPLPKVTDRRPSWDIVISYVAQLQSENSQFTLGVGSDVISLVLSDMRDRDAVGRQRYGTPLTSGTGRDHLVDAYRKMLDGCVYLMNELDEHGVDLTSSLSEEEFPDWAQRWYLRDVQYLCASQIRSAIHLRGLIKERSERAQLVTEGEAS